ncbi:MAG: FHA domain-containing protein [Polyangiaceae bacterium]
MSTSECQQCGERNQATSRFCVACGLPIEAALPAPVAVRAAGAVDASSALKDRPPQPPGVLFESNGSPKTPFQPRPGSLSPPPVLGTDRPPGHVAPVAAVAGAARGLSPVQPGAEAPRTLAGFLVSYETVPLGQYWPIHQGRNVVGRLGAAPALDVEISHPTTSSRHAVLTASARPGRVVIEDSGSTNGTFVNDVPVPAGQPWEVNDGDRVRFGLFNAVIKLVRV